MPDLTTLVRATRIGINRADLQWETEAVRETVVTALRRIPGDYFRSSMREAALATLTAQLFRRIQDNGKRVVALTSLTSEDFTNGDADKVNDRFPVSGVNYVLAEARMSTYCQALVANGVIPGAFQLLNEIDIQNTNGDIPLTGLVEDEDLAPYADAYDAYVASIRSVIQAYYPTTPILPFGIANFRGVTSNAAVRNPGVMLSLCDLSPFAGISVHVYPGVSDNIPAFIPQRLEKFVDDTGSLLPVWITEWGSLNSQYPDGNGRTRLQMFQQVHDALLSTAVRITAMLHYSFDDFGNKAIVDANYVPLAEAQYFTDNWVDLA